MLLLCLFWFAISSGAEHDILGDRVLTPLAKQVMYPGLIPAAFSHEGHSIKRILLHGFTS